MKKQLLSITMLLFGTLMYAQNTFSRYDVNHDGKENIQDVNILINRLLGKTNFYVTGITLSCSQISLGIGDIKKLTVTIVPSDADDMSVLWTSSSPTVVTIDESGNMKALSIGSSTITCSANDGSGVYAACNVTVTNSSSGGGTGEIDPWQSTTK